MKNNRMVKAITNSLKDNLCGTVAFMLGTYAIGMIMWLVVTNITKDFEEGILTIGSILGLVMGLFMLIFMGGAMFRANFNVAIGMSFTRKDFVICDLIATTISTCVVLLLGRLMFMAESTLYTSLFSDQAINEELASVMKILYSAPMIALTIGMVLAVKSIMGLVFLVFRERGMLILVVGYWAVMILVSRLGTAGKIARGAVAVYNKLASVSISLPPLIGTAILLVITYLASIGIRRQAVV